MIPERELNIAKNYCLSSPDRESCGLFCESNKKIYFIKCENKSNNPRYEFVIDPYVFIDNNVKYVFHSHTESSAHPSRQDILYSDELEVPFLIYSIKEDSFFLYENVSV